MRVAVDFQSVRGKRTGIGSFAANLVESAAKLAPDIEWLLYGKKGERDLRTPGRIVWESAEIPIRALKDKADLVYSPGFAPAWASPAPQVVTVHDLIGMLYPQNQKTVSRFYWSRWLPAALKRAKRLVASSESTRRDMERLLGIPASRVDVVRLSADDCYRRLEDGSAARETMHRYGLDRPFFLCVGTLEPRKNLKRLLEAYKLLVLQKKDSFLIVLAGKPAGAEKELLEFIREHKLEKGVRMLGYIPTEDIVALYNGSLGYVSVSLYEGFGLPALEAMRCGKSGVATNRSSMPEVTGETALAVDPENVEAIAAALDDYAADAPLREKLCARALQRSAEFSSEKAASQMIAIFRETAKN